MKKAGGVYYTPSYIVDYIVKNTVGRLLGDFVIPSPPVPSVVEGAEESTQTCHSEPFDSAQDKLREESRSSIVNRNSKFGNLKPLTPKQVSNIKILDPACGSGSFLIGAYQYLLDWHLRHYTQNDPEKHAKGRDPKIYEANSIRHCEEPGDEAISNYRLTIAEKKRILLNSIFGVDIDSQAVEVTKLSLLLKVLEGESSETIENQHRLFHERALPDLAANIKCGNSLIAPDFYDTVVIPSAPVPSAAEGNNQLRTMNNELYQRINAFDWQAEFPQIFNRQNPGFDAVIGNPPYLYSAGQEHAEYFKATYRLSQYQTDFYVYFIERAISLAAAGGRFSFIVSDSWLNSQQFSKIRNHLLANHRIERIAVFDYPVFKKAALENSIFVISVGESPNTVSVDTFSDPNSVRTTNTLEPRRAMERGLIDPRYQRRDEALLGKIETNSLPLESRVKLNRGIHAYRTDGYGKSKYSDGTQTKRDKEELSYHAHSKLDETYLPEIKGKHVLRFSYLPTGVYISYGPWLAEARTPDLFYSPKVALRKILGPKLHGTYIEEPYALDQSLYVLISPCADTSDLKFLLGVLLSRLAAWYIRTKHSIYDTLYPWYTKKQLATFPVRPKSIQIVKLVERMLDLHKQLAAAKVPDEKTRIQRQIDATDKQIDQLVYNLYGLSEEEIKIVESGTS